jgi:ADP-ribose pyrophosphatase YjhB (NUDIX family)
MTSQFKYCPFCATLLLEKSVSNVLRPACPACGFISFLEPKLVTVVVVQHAGKILLGRRNMNPSLGKWTFLGGYVDRGEKVEDAAIREVKEETNLDVHLDQLLGLYSEKDNPHVLVAYAASVIHDDISGLALQPDEISELAFFPLEEIPELAFPFDSQILQDWKNKV